MSEPKSKLQLYHRSMAELTGMLRVNYGPVDREAIEEEIRRRESKANAVSKDQMGLRLE